MSYIKRTTTIKDGELIITEKKFSGRYGKKCIRSRNTGETIERQKAINRRRADERRILLGMNNFSLGDWWITLTYSRDNRPSAFDEAHKNFTKFLAKLKRKYGADLKYMGKTELPSSGAVHHHLILCGNVDLKDVFSMWKFGNIKNVKQIYSVLDMELMNYFVKHDVESCVECKFTASRNLKKPDVKVEKIRSRSVLKKPRPKKGYVVTDIQEYDDELGFAVQRYVMVKEGVDVYGNAGLPIPSQPTEDTAEEAEARQ